MSNETGGHWQCAYSECLKALPNIQAQTLPSCPYCRKVQPGYNVEGSPTQPLAAGAGSPGSHTSHQSSSTDSTWGAGQQSGQQAMLTQQQMQEMQQMEESRRHQSLSYEQLQQLQQLTERRTMLQQLYKREQQLKSMIESNGGGQQLDDAQRQQLIEQWRMARQQIAELQEVQKQQELQFNSNFRVESGQQPSHDQQQQQQILDNQRQYEQQQLREQQMMSQQQQEYEHLQHWSALEPKLLLLDSQQQQLLYEQQKKLNEQRMHQGALQQHQQGVNIEQLQNVSGGQQLGHGQQQQQNLLLQHQGDGGHQRSHDQHQGEGGHQASYDQHQGGGGHQASHDQHQGGGGHQPSHDQHQGGGGHQWSYDQHQGGGGHQLSHDQHQGGGGHQRSHDQHQGGGGHQLSYDQHQGGGGHQPSHDQHQGGGGHQRSYDQHQGEDGHQRSYDQHQGEGGHQASYDQHQGGGGHQPSHDQHQGGGGHQPSHDQHQGGGGHQWSYDQHQGGGGHQLSHDQHQGGGGHQRSHDQHQGGGGHQLSYDQHQGGGGHQPSHDQHQGGGGHQRSYDQHQGEDGHQRSYDQHQGGGGHQPSHDQHQGGGGHQRSHDQHQGGGGHQRSHDQHQGGGGHQRSYDQHQGGGGHQPSHDQHQGGGGHQRSHDQHQGGGGHQRSYDQHQGGGGHQPSQYDVQQRRSQILQQQRERGHQPSHDQHQGGGGHQRSHDQHQGGGGHQRSYDQHLGGGGHQPSQYDVQQRISQILQQQGEGGHQPSRDQYQLTADEYEQNVKHQALTWQRMSQDHDTLRQQQQGMQQHQRILEHKQRIQQQQSCNIKQQPQKQVALNQGQGNHQADEVVRCVCGTPFHPHARVCANPNCGKPRPRNQPQGPPCVYCHKPLMKEGATMCGSCHKKQPETPTKLPKAPATSIPPPPGYGYPNQPQQQPGGVQLQSTTEMIVSPSSVPHMSQSSMVFGQMATISSYGMTFPVIAHQPTNSQTHLGGKPGGARPSAKMSPNAQQQQASSTHTPQGSPSTGVSGAQPSSQGNDGDNNQTGGRPPPGVPATARPTKDQSAGEQNSAVLPPNSNLQTCTTDPLNENMANISNKEKQMDDNNNKETASETNGKPSNCTTDAASKNEVDLTANRASGPPESQSTPKSGSGDGNAPDPPLDNGESHNNLNQATSENNKGGQSNRGKGTNSTNDKTYAAAAAAARTDQKQGEWHNKKSKEPEELYPGNKTVQKSGKQSSAKPPKTIILDVTGLECNDPKTSVKLVFHAIVPLPYWEWDNKSRIYIRFGHPKLGDWDYNCGEFEVVRKIDDLHCEMTCTFDKFNMELLNYSKSIPYKYIIVDSPKVVEKDDCFEFLHAHRHLGDANRCLRLSIERFLHIHRMRPEKRIYHKYDTVVYPKKTQISKSWTEKVADYASRFKGWLTRKKQTGGSKEEEEFVPLDFHDMSVFCFQSYLEKYKDIVCEGRFQQGTNIVEIVNSVAHVFNSLLSFAVFTQGYGSRTVLEQVPDTNKYREEVKAWTISLLKKLEECPLEEPGKQLTAAFFILACLGKTFRTYQHLPHSAILSLIKMITLNPEPEKKSCPDYDFLKNCLGGSQSTCVEVSDYIGNLCKKVAVMKTEGSPIEWMLALPLYHFLKEQSEPFGEPELTVLWERELIIGLKSAQQKANKLENFVVTHYHDVKPYFALDPLLPAVFVALTPEAEFHLLCEKMPPFLTASWLTKNILERGIVGRKEVEIWTSSIQCVKDSLIGQDIAKEHLLSVVKSSYQIFEFAWKKEPTSELTLSLMCQSASYILHAIAHLDEVTTKDIDSVWQWDDRSKVFGQMKEALRKWIARTDVIGGSMFGGSVPQYGRSTARKYKGDKELKYWNSLLSIDTATQQATQDWHNIIKQLIHKRINSMESAKFKIDLVCMMEGIANISPVLADTVMEAGYHAIDVLCTKPQYSGDNDFERLATLESERVGNLLGRILERQYPNADDIQSVSFYDLLEWYMWPIFITIFVSKPVLRRGIPEQYHITGICACSCLEGMCEKLQNGEVTIEDLHNVRSCRDQMKRLCSAVSSSKEGNDLTMYKSVEAAVTKRVEECEALRRRIEVLSHLCRQIHSVNDKVQGLEELQAELRKDINKAAISKMCVRNEKDDVQLICFLSAGSLLKFTNEFQVVSGQKYGNDLFTEIWRGAVRQAITDNPQLTLDDIYASVWQPSLEQCRRLLESLMDLSMKLSDVDIILKPHQARLETQLQLLFKGMNEIALKYENPPLVDRAARRVRDYWNLRRYQEGADTFLKLKNTLGLTTGDFRLVERLSQQLSTSMKDQTLHDVDESLIEAGRFLEDVAREPKKVHCLERFARCQDIVKWLKEVTKDVHEIQSFVNVALATAAGGEGDLSHDKLSHLRTVGSGFASLIYNFPKNAGFVDLKKACTSVWEALDKNENLPKLLEDCNKDIGWYQSVKETQGSVEVTSYGQMRNILRYGIYQVGVTSQSRLAHSIHDLITVKLIPRDKQLTKMSYNLDELRDLESKLVLITGSKAANRKEVDHYLNILQHVTRIAEVLLALQQAGNVTYSGWKVSFDCATYTVIGFGQKQELQLQEETADQRVKELQACAKKMEEDLTLWENEVKELRSHHYELNYYTTLQLLRLRKELGLVRQNPTKSIDPQILALLESISPEVTTESMHSIISSLEKQLLDLRAAANFLPEEVTEEEPAESEVTDDLNGASVSTELHTAAPTVVEIPSPSLSSVRRLTTSDKPHLTEKDLSDSQKEILADLVEYKGYSRLLVLKGLERSPDNANQYDIQDWCDEYEDVYNYEEEEEEEETTASSDELSSDSGSDDEEKVNVFDQPSLAAASPGSVKQKSSPTTIIPKVKIVHRHIINESHPVVQQLVEEYEYDLDASIEAVQLFGMLDRAMDYLARKDADDEDEEAVTPKVAIVEPTADESGNIVVFDDPDAEGKYLSLDELGMVLRTLSQQLPGSVIAQRTFNDELKCGAPNLLVIPSGDILRTVLALYMENEDLPLPTLEEVLICDSTTTAEEVNLLWQRAIGDPGNERIFCLVHAEKLSYQVCDEVVETLKELSQGKQDYRLVILCSKEGEDKSHIVSKLLLHKKSIILKHSEESYQTYLKSHFICRVGDSSSQIIPDRASAIDRDNSSVRVVSSERTGMGKSLYIQRMATQLKTVTKSELTHCQVVIPIHGPVVTPDVVLTFLKEHYRNNKCMIYHFDIAPSILSEVDTILFSLLILHGLTDSQGCVWRRHMSQLYAIEVTLSEKKSLEVNPAARTIDLLSLLPTVECISPKEAMEASTLSPSQIGMDDGEFRNSTFQRVYQYLRRQDKGQKLDRFKYQGTVEGKMADCLQHFLRSCGVQNPSWSEVHHFAKFLDLQLESCEKSVFCDETFVGDVMSGLKGFVVKFMIRMSRDFATPSLEGEVARGDMEDNPVQDTNNLQQYNIEHRRKWEESSHPYIFFNDDGISITFVGFIITSKGDLVDPRRTVLEARIMHPRLYAGLKHQGVNFSDDYRNWEKAAMLQKLSMVMGVDFVHDPDETYVLTVDNLIKILAIQMRFRCGIPVVIMGETGCGKTRLIRYMCELAREGREARNMLILKVHGGTKEGDIIRFIAEAEEEAEKNRDKNMDTVVFFDEANTTDAIGLIKEILCDRRLHGRPVSDDLKFIAACNPYRRHSDEMIERLEKAGLGFYVRASETQQRLGHIPLRELVYRVLDLPPSMRPLVYDFGQLKKDTEDDYIKQIVHDHVRTHPTLSNEDPGIVPAIAGVLAASQAYMRDREDECSFVSLRDVERAMIVFKYFYEKMPDFQLAAKEQQPVPVPVPEEATVNDPLKTITSALVLAVSVCYHSRLQDRTDYENIVASHFVAPLVLPGKQAQFTTEIRWYQNILLDNMELGPNIAKNAALRENVFMMAICIELRIPLFLVGKPGSSKSLAKSIIQDSMHGKTSRSNLLKKFKQVQMFSYQCSQLATPESVIEVFNSAKKFQDKLDSTQFVSVVVLDEVGLAEDSPNLPLKALHPLLEDGTEGAGAKGKDEIIVREKRVAFIGISNWALDPAKMNRGVMVTRGIPDLRELEFSARGICGKEDKDQIKNKLDPYFKPLAQAYKTICKKQQREFFGLRDFYSLIKMLYWMCKKSRGLPLTWPQMKHAIMRNFGGLKSEKVNPFQEFCSQLNMADEEPNPNDYEDFEEIWPVINPDCTRLGLIKTSLDTRETSFHGENRYLLFLTENYAALDILKHYIRGKGDGRNELSATSDAEGTVSQKPFTLFGSSFPKDREYTQVCRNINQIKICMETGRTVILLNLENLYESLYDVLNQYYMHYGDSRYVDLGLQTHRVKCRVHNDFKLILIAERATVYEKFPTPLINRLEKHFVLTSSVLKEWQVEVLDEFREWIKGFSRIRDHSGKGNFKEGHAFIGYQKDTPAAVVFQASKQLKKLKKGLHLKSMDMLTESGILGNILPGELINEDKGSDMWKEAVLRLSQYLLLQTASDDSLVRLKMSDLAYQQEELMRLYFSEQHHNSVADFVYHHIQNSDGSKEGLLLQVTTHGHILLREELMELVNMGAHVDMKVESFLLQEFDTELDFSNKVGPLFQRDEGDKQSRLLVIQCDSGHLNGDLIACARYRIYDERVNALNRNKIQRRDGITHVLFIINLPHQVSASSFVGFQGDPWISAHIDDLRPTSSDTIEPLHAIATNISDLFIGGYIQDIAPLMGTILDQYQQQISESESEESFPEEDETTPPTQVTPLHDASEEADIEDEGSESEDDSGEHQMEPELLAGSSTPESAHSDHVEPLESLEQLAEFPGQTSVPFEPVTFDSYQQQSFQEQEDDQSPTEMTTAQNNLTNELKVIDIEDEDEMEFPTANIPRGSPVFVNTEPTVTAYQENPVYLESMNDDRYQEGLSPQVLEPVEDEQPVLTSMDDSVIQSQAILLAEPEILQVPVEMNTEEAFDQEVHPIPLATPKSAKRQPRSGQCRRLYGCIQAAASKLEDSTKDRSTQRVTRLTKLIQRSPDHLNPQSFHGILVMHIYRLLQEREFDRPDLIDWVLGEALNASNLEVGGTFRNVLARKIDEVVIPIFAKIIASIDRNYNLDLINPKAGDSPLVQFWLAMFQAPKVQQLRYSETVQGGKVLGLGGRKLDQDFKCQLPFFWLVKDAVDSQWDNARSQAGVSWQMHHEQLCAFVRDTPVGAILESVDSDNYEDFYKRYLHDFVMGMHRCKHKSSDLTAMELQLISDALDHIVHCSVLQHKSLTSMIAALHLAYGTNKSQILWFNQLVSHSPSIMYSLQGMLPSKELPEMELHLYATEKMMEKLEPPLKKDNPNPNLAQWLNHVRLSQNTIDSILSLRSQSERVVKARQSWCRLRATQLFVEHVMLKHPEVDLKLLARRLCGRWERNCDFLKVNTVNGVQLQLNTMEKTLKKECDDKKRKEVKRSCRGFFMEIVSNLCFRGQAAPEPDLVKMLLDTVFMEKDQLHTQELTPYKDDKSAGDKIPTVRSFLLQLLLEHSVDQVRDHLRDYLDRSYRVLVGNQAGVADQNLYLLIIQCFEDALCKKLSTQNVASIIEEVTTILLEGYNGLLDHRRGTPTLEYLEGVAKVRYSLSIVAEVLKNERYGHHFMELLRAAGRMCADREVNCIDLTGHKDTVGPVIYLLKLIVRQYGMPCLKAAAEIHEWLIPAQLKSNQEKSVDPFVIYGDLYKSLRGALNDAMYGNQTDALDEATQTLKPCEVPYFLLALYEKATLSRTTDNSASRISDDALERLNDFVMNYQLLSNELRFTARALLANQQGGRILEQMSVSPRQPLQCRTILGVVVHAAAVFFGRQKIDVLLPFVNMLNNPALLNQSYLPTMQEDPLVESQVAMVAGDRTGQFYECPNGHKYFIGNCGRTYYTGVCNVCKSPIGGTSGNPLTGNKLTATQDTTKKGHDLGAPENRTHATPERNLSARAVCILRALMHSAFVWASCNNEPALEAIASLVTPQVLPQNLPEFFWAHLEKDFELLGRDTGKGLDEVVMIVHLVLRHILTTDPPIGGTVQTVSSLDAKEARKEWERIFNQHYIQPVLSTLDENLAIAMDRVANDEQQDHDQLFYLMYEKVKYTEESLEPHLWTYCSRITLEHLRQTLQEKKMKERYTILHEFLQAETELRATQYLPDIARLQQCLYDRFNRQIDRKDVKKQTIQAFIKELPNETTKNEYREMVSSVKAAWTLVGHKLKNHGRLPVEEKFYVAVIDDNTQMEYLVPTTSEAGVCTTALVDFLTQTHNNFIERCRALVAENDQSTLSFWRELKVPITHLHRCHLLDYEHQLPSIILSHCHYSLKVGKGQDVKYDHQALEKHVLNRFIHGKPLILLDIPQVVYRKDIYTTGTFADVRKKVEPQEKLQQRIRQDIVAELRTPDRLREALDVVEIVLGFLSSGGGKPDKQLGEYIDKTLRMKKRRFSQKAKSSCQLKHALSLWETIAVELARQLCLRGQEPFDSIRKEFLCELSKDADRENQFEALDRCLGQFDPDLLLGTLYEFIETYVKHCPLHEHDQPLVVTLELVLEQYGTKLPQLAAEFPASIKLNQAVAAWKHIVHYYATRH